LNSQSHPKREFARFLWHAPNLRRFASPAKQEEEEEYPLESGV
jgi:hypothetical protein